VDRVPSNPQPASESTEPAAQNRRFLTRKNSYVSMKVYDPNADEDETESRKRVEARQYHKIGPENRNLKERVSPFVMAMEKEHKIMLAKLNLDGIKIPPPLSDKEMKISHMSDININLLDAALKELTAFEQIYGSSSEYSAENYFKGLLD